MKIHQTGNGSHLWVNVFGMASSSSRMKAIKGAILHGFSFAGIFPRDRTILCKFVARDHDN